MITPKQTQLVQNTWQQVLPVSETVADLFYRRLFELDPGCKALFRDIDLDAQKTKLLQTMSATITSLHAIEPLLYDLTEMGRRHAWYGVTAYHYQTVGAALLWALERGLGEAWTPEVQAAWAAAYALIAEQMIAGTEAAHADDNRRVAVN